MSGIYNTNIRNLPEKMQIKVDIIIQEFKRSVVLLTGMQDVQMKI